MSVGTAGLIFGNIAEQPSPGLATAPNVNHGAAVPVVGANPESAKVTSYPAFDWLRFVLASIVALAHEGVPFPGPITGALAVEVFFALSGWLIGSILLETRPTELPRFFFNRATRIWIPYAAAVGLLYGFAAVYQGVDTNWAKYLFYDGTFTHQIFTKFPAAAHEMPLDGSGNQFWSISVEEQFYLLAPLVMLLPFGRNLLTWVVIAGILMVAPVLGTPIALGVVAAILHRKYGAWHQAPAARIVIGLATAGLLAALFLENTAPLRALFAIGVVLSLAMPGKRHALPVFLGGISYPVYLNHWVGAFVAHGFTHRMFGMGQESVTARSLNVAIAYPASLAVGAAAYLLIDRQVLARRQEWFTRARGIACGSTAYALVAIGIVGGLLIERGMHGPAAHPAAAHSGAIG